MLTCWSSELSTDVLLSSRYYVDLSTGKSQWEPPILPGEAPPSYETLEQSSSTPASASNLNAARNNDGSTPVLGSNNPFNSHRNRSRSSSTDLGGITPSGTKGKDIQLEEDARLAAQLQAEEDARARERAQSQSQGPADTTSQSQSRGENASYYDSNTNNPDTDRPPLQTSQSHPELETQQSHSSSSSSRRKGGFLHKLASKAQEKLSNAASSSSSSSHHSSRARYPLGPYYGTSQPMYYTSQPGMHSGYGYPMGGGVYYQPCYGDPYRRRHGGMGTAGAAALGLGGGLLGGALLANAIDDHDHDYGYGDGYDGGDFGGGDFGGGDFF